MEQASARYLALPLEERQKIERQAIAALDCGYCSATRGDPCILTTRPVADFCHVGRRMRFMAAALELEDML